MHGPACDRLRQTGGLCTSASVLSRGRFRLLHPFTFLLIVSFVLLRLSGPADPLEAGAWLRTQAGSVALALYLVPFGHRVSVVHRQCCPRESMVGGDESYCFSPLTFSAAYLRACWESRIRR